jgi:immune inhibitor A
MTTCFGMNCHPRPLAAQLVAPSPDVLRAMRDEFHSLVLSAPAALRSHLHLGEPTTYSPGLNDGLIYPPEDMPERLMGLAPEAAPAGPGPVRGVVRVIAILAEFPDHRFATDRAHYEQLLFSDGAHPTGSLRDYYSQASYGKVLISGEICGPYQLPEPYSYYVAGQSGTGGYPHNAQRMTEDAVAAASADVDFSPFDPNGDGYVDALIIVHAGRGAEAVPSSDRVNHVWSHKWVLSHKVTHNGMNLYAYLTVPEDGRLGVWAHELGHLLFQWPDLYDTDYSSSGLGNWCIMAGGSWNDGGDTPALPSAWCKLSQGWADAEVVTGKKTLDLPRSADHQRIWKLWTAGLPRAEYFLVENRARYGFDARLPGEGLLIYHVDEAQAGNSREPHYKVALVQADGLQDLENKADSGDAGDPYPGDAGNRIFDRTSAPASLTYAGAPTGVAIRHISDPGIIMSAVVDVTELYTSPVITPTPPANALPERPVGEVPGIGDVRSRKLADIGIHTLVDLAGAQPDDVALALRVSLETANEFVTAAGQLLSL